MGWSDQVILMVFCTVSLQSQGWFEATSQNRGSLCHVWLSSSLLLPPSGGFSIYKTAHRIGLRILSIALQEELKVHDFA